MPNLSGFFKKLGGKIQSDSAREILKVKYRAFQTLLAENNLILEVMADLGEKLSGEYLFDMHYIKTKVRLIGHEVSKLINNLNILSNNKYPLFPEIHSVISHEIEKILEYKMEVPVSDPTVSLENLTEKTVGIAGGKIAHLGEVKGILRLPTPEGFAISSYAFIKFIEQNNLREKIREKLSSVSIEDMEGLNKAGKDIQAMIATADIPPRLNEAIGIAYAELCKKAGANTMVSVRSSAIREDSEFSFAGQYATFLNIPGALIPQKYKEVVASLFSPRAIFYAKSKGFSEGEMVMAAGVLNMIDATAGGVMYSRDPNDPSNDHILINAVHGLGVWVVDGTVTPDTYTVSRHPEGTIIDKNISAQEKMLVPGEAGELKEVMVPDAKRGKQCLSDEQIKILAEYALALENHYGSPRDIEWAAGSDKKIYILQSRPLRTFARYITPGSCLPSRFEGYSIILDKGVIACKGAGSGKAFVLEDEEDLKDFPRGAVLIAKHTSPKFVTVMNKASAIITDVGSATGHMASLSREYQVPTILDTEVSTGVIRHGREITVDAVNCIIYEGKVPELLEYALSRKEPFRETHLFKTLEKVLKWIVPLNLTDPDAETFSPEYCRTYHDITRFAHEVSMQEMFTTGKEQDIEGTPTVDLVADIPIKVHILDIDGGMRENIKKASLGDILSIPFSALLRGMRSMKWPGPMPVDAKGFSGLHAQASSVPEEQLRETERKSFAIVSRNYVNFSIRLGYHFSMVEAYAGENINDNYIKFFFRGGGASLDRKLRRVTLIKDIIKETGFKVNVREDIIDAVLTKYKQSAIEDKLVIIGKLTAYTKQLDMAMFNDAITEMYINQFIEEHIKPAK